MIFWVFSKTKRSKVASIGLMAAFLSGCTVAPSPIGMTEMNDELSRDRALAYKDMEPIVGPISLEEAIARAIKYNLDHRIGLMEQAVARGELDLSRYDMLPSFLAKAGYNTRSEPRLSRQENALTGENIESDPTISADQSSGDFSMELSWSLLDFGASYYQARQNSSRLLIASERRRRAMHLLIMDVQTAYWRAASAQELEGQIKRTVRVAKAAIKDARRAQQGNAKKPMEHLEQLQTLLRSLRDIQNVRQQLGAARVELAHLINAPVGQRLALDPDISVEIMPEVLNQSMESLELVALFNNGDLKEPFYDVRIAALETRRALLDLFPDLTLNWGPQYTTDSFTLSDTWNEGAFALSYNLFNLFKINNVRANVEAREQLARMRRVAMQMNVVAQVHLAALQSKNARDRLDIAEDLLSVEREIEGRMFRQHTAGTISEAELVRAQTAAMVAQLQRYQAVAGFHSAMGRLQASLGVEPLISSINETSLGEIKEEVKLSLEQWYSGAAVRQEVAKVNRATAKLSDTSASVRHLTQDSHRRLDVSDTWHETR